MSQGDLTRREFVSDSSKLALGAMIVPRHVVGQTAQRRAPSDTLNVAIVGMGQQGTENAQDLLDENIVAICDVDLRGTDERVDDRTRERDGTPRESGVRLQEMLKSAGRYTDFRRMLEERTEIDAVLIATPDHNHAIVAKTAMELGKHVYVQKPLTYSVHEARALAETARRTGVTTQMGNQGHSSDDARLINEWVQAGVIGPVREVRVWTNRPIWPQGVPQPAASNDIDDDDRAWNQRGVNDAMAAALGGRFNPPRDMDWDLYLGGVADDVPYHPIYHPFNWRGWVHFGVGALGDMGAHLIDHPYWALGLTYPTAIEATSTPWGTVRVPAEPGSERMVTREVSYPQAMTVHYEFPRRGLQPPVRLSWYDGGLAPPRPDALPIDAELLREGGVLMIGERGVLMHNTYGRNPRIFPESLRAEAEAVPQTYARIETGHIPNWAAACKGEAEASSPFEYAAALTETMLLGIVALRAGQSRKILYDAERMQITNAPDANQYLTRVYRPGWEV